MSKSGLPMLTDFGLSRELQYSITALRSSAYGTMKGTIPWMAYELLEDDNFNFICTEATDMWAFGMVVYVRPFLVKSISSAD